MFKIRLRASPIFAAFLALIAISAATELALRHHLVGGNERADIFSPILSRAGHYTRGWTNEPGISSLLVYSTYANYVGYNNKGLRGVDRQYEPAPDVYRIVLLGDSFMEGYQIRDSELFSTRLEAALGDRTVEVINLSVGGYGTTQQYLYLKEEGLKYQPDLVLLAFNPGSDIRENSYHLQMLYRKRQGMLALSRPYVVPGDDETLVISVPPAPQIDYYDNWRDRQIAIARNASFWSRLLIRRYASTWRKKEKPPNVNPNVLYGPYIGEFDPQLWFPEATDEHYREAWARGWSTTKRLILAISDLAEQAGSAFAVMMIPARIQADRRYLTKIENRYPELEFALDRIDVEAQQFARSHGIRMLNLTPVFRDHDERFDERLYFGEENQHWNQNGHRVAAEAVARSFEDCLLATSNEACPAVTNDRTDPKVAAARR